MSDTEVCDLCEERKARGQRHEGRDCHCRECHATWGGLNAQHCVLCHKTFVGIGAADDHRVSPNRTSDEPVVLHPQSARCLDVENTPGWRESRPGVWTNTQPMTAEAKKEMKGQP